MGGAVIFVITIASMCTSLIYKFILVPLDMTYLKTIAFILRIAALVQLVEMILKKTMPSLYQALGVYLSADHHQLCRAGCCAYECSGWLWCVEGYCLRIATAVGFTDRDRADGRSSGEDRIQ